MHESESDRRQVETSDRFCPGTLGQADRDGGKPKCAPASANSGGRSRLVLREEEHDVPDTYGDHKVDCASNTVVRLYVFLFRNEVRALVDGSRDSWRHHLYRAGGSGTAISLGGGIRC